MRTSGVPSTVALVGIAVYALAKKLLAGGSRTESCLNEGKYKNTPFPCQPNDKESAHLHVFFILHRFSPPHEPFATFPEW